MCVRPFLLGNAQQLNRAGQALSECYKMKLSRSGQVVTLSMMGLVSPGVFTSPPSAACVKLMVASE